MNRVMRKNWIYPVAAALMVLVFSAGLGRFSAAKADQYIYRNNILDVVVSSDDGNVSFRAGPGLGYNVMQLIYNGTSLTVTGVSQNSTDGLVWGEVKYNGTTGWIAIQNTTVTSVENSARAEYDVKVTVAENIYLRTGPGAEYPSLYRPYNGQTLRIYQTVVNSFDGRPWGRTSINGLQGWVSLNWTERVSSWTYNQAQDVTFYNNIYNATVSASDNYVNLRTGPGLGYSVITPIYNGNTLSVTAAVDNSSDGLVWGYTSYNGYSGWIAMENTTITGMSNASVAQYTVWVGNSNNIKLRKGPGTEYDLLVGYIPNNTSLYITQTVINSFDGRPWGKTSYNGYSGWVSLNWTYR